MYIMKRMTISKYGGSDSHVVFNFMDGWFFFLNSRGMVNLSNSNFIQSGL